MTYKDIKGTGTTRKDEAGRGRTGMDRNDMKGPGRTGNDKE